MITKGTLVRYHGRETADLWEGKYLSVAERRGDTAEVYLHRVKPNKWTTTTVAIADLEEIHN